MPRYNRRYGYARKTRYARRNRRILSTRNIYSNRSSRSQASQIQALNKKVNTIYRKTKPERKVILDVAPQTVTLSSRVAGATESHLAALDIATGAEDYNRTGDKIYRKDTYYFSLEYFNTSQSGYHSSESSGCQLRLILGQYKAQTQYDSAPVGTDIIAHYSSTGVGYSMCALSPLVNGVTETYNIWKDMRFTMTIDRNQRMVKVTTPWYSCRYKDVYNSNHSFVLLEAAGLHYDNDFTEYVELTVSRKTVFTDA